MMYGTETTRDGDVPVRAATFEIDPALEAALADRDRASAAYYAVEMPLEAMTDDRATWTACARNAACLAWLVRAYRAMAAGAQRSRLPMGFVHACDWAADRAASERTDWAALAEAAAARMEGVK